MPDEMMNNPEINRHLQQIFDAHGEVFAALRTATTKMGEAIQAHDDAISRAIEANQAALKLLRLIQGEAPPA